jgi:hypothetical protein
VIIPLVSTDGDTVIGSQPFVPAAGQQLFSVPLEEIHKVHIIGTAFLIICKMHIHAHGRTSYLWRLPIL